MTVSQLSLQEERILRLRAQGLSYKEVAHLVGASHQTVKNHMTAIYRKFEATNLQDLLNTIGWVVIPGEPPQEPHRCNFVAQCSRQMGHRGHHGGFRPV